MIESMSSGTPVIAWNNGSVPEIIEDGVSGAIVGSMDEAVAAVERVRHFDRTWVRQAFERRFTAEHMAQNYIAAFEALIADGRPKLKLVAAE